MLKRISIGSAVGITSLVGYKAYTDRDFQRGLTLYREIGPIITHYRWVEFKHKHFPPTAEEEEEAYARLHTNYSTPLMETLRDLRGFYIKVGQILANRSDMLPDVYIEKLRTLEDQVPHMLNGQEAKALIAQSLGIEFDEVFSDFNEKPIGSASIGQVHKAVLRKSKQPVAIKVQSPNAEDLFRGDIKTAKSFCSIFAPEQLVLFEEIEKQFMTEFDYKCEAQNLLTVGKNMEPFKKSVVIPKPYMEYCSKHVLTMEFLKGPKLVDGIRQQGEKYAALQGKTLKQLEAEMRKDFEENGMPKPYDGPSAFTLELYRKVLKTSDFVWNLSIYVVNQGVKLLSTLGLPLNAFQYHESFVPLNSSFIMDTLLKVHGHQLLVNGFFNADTHPGNFLLLEDGRIGMIDYGQVKIITEEERLIMCGVVKAIAENDREYVKKLNATIGYKSKYMNADVIYKMCVIGFDQDGRQVTEGLNLQQFMDKMYALDPWEKTPAFSVMVTRLSLLLRGVGLMLNHPVSVCTAWKPIAVAELNKTAAK